MPVARYYEVTEERKIKIRASKPGEAAAIAERIFAGEGSDDDARAISEPIRSTDLTVREEI